MLMKFHRCGVNHSIKNSSWRSCGTSIIMHFSPQSHFMARKTFNNNTSILNNHKYHSKSYHTQPHVKFILSEKDYERLKQQQDATPQTSPHTTSKSTEQTQQSESMVEQKEANPSSSTEQNQEENTTQNVMNNGSIPQPLENTKITRDELAFANPFYRDVDEKTAIEYEDALNDKERTPFPMWLMRVYRYAAIGVALFIFFGVLNNYREEPAVQERYKILEEKRKKRLEQMNLLEQEMDFHNMAKEKSTIKAIKSALTMQDQESK
ncbi:hypothetical protein C9374_004902 [Naegleria lovaniensis]|uniref:Transmembrane protein n=1 Tax=Naegleria lovaniensis TaxID=51637 RepID=A0AA88GRU9_NAELO|nr:uncharacterized protein C9374_004902 [Naegleria lovaniensis]KAG2382935.1 hypothetical protein C9374_004902 [Naegleria lovaniensis]